MTTGDANFQNMLDLVLSLYGGHITGDYPS